MARHASPAVQWVQYLTARLVAAGLLSFDVETNLRAAAAFGRLQFYGLPRLCALPGLNAVRALRSLRDRPQRAVCHLRQAFPHLGEHELEQLAMRSFEHLFELIIEVCHTPRLIHQDSWSHRIRLGRIGETLEIMNRGRPAIMVTAHVGNWEILGYMMAVIGYRVNALARPLDNQLINDWLLGVRQRKGLKVITKWHATDEMRSVLDEGGLLGFIADQNAGDKGLFVPFFGRLASAYKSIGLLALTQKLPIICGYAKRLDRRCRFEFDTVDIIYPHDWSNQRDPLYYITARYTRAIETMVRTSPDQYLWMHRRWKSRPRYERQGRPMPAALKRKLEALPWMDQQQMDRLLQPPGPPPDSPPGSTPGSTPDSSPDQPLDSSPALASL